MTDTTFVDKSTVIPTTWLQDVNNVAYRALGSGGVAPTTPAAVRANIDVVSATAMAGPTGASLVGFIQPEAGAVQRTLLTVIRGTKRASDFGLVAGGSSAVNAAALAAVIATGKHVEIEDGAYTVNAGSTIATPGQNIIFQSRNAQIIAATDFDVFNIAASFVELRGGTVTGPNTGTTATSSAARFTDCTRSVLRFMQLEKFGYGVRGQAATNNHVNRVDSCYLFNNSRAGVYVLGHAGTVVGGEIAGSLYGVLQVPLQAGAAVAIDRDNTSETGEMVLVEGVTIESIGVATKAVTGAVTAAGLIRLTVVTHGYTSGDYTSVNNVVGTVEANGVWGITVIDADHFDLRASVFVNAYISGGTCRRGAAVYSGVGQAGVRVIACYFEDVPVVAQWGDAFKNNGVTAHTEIVYGGCVNHCFSNNVTGQIQSSFLVNARSDMGQVIGNYGQGTNQSLINSRDNNFGGELNHFGNRGFAREYETTGTQAVVNAIFKPTTKNNDAVLEALVPVSNGSQTLGVGFLVANHLLASFTAFCGGYFLTTALRGVASATAPDPGAGGTIATASVTTARVGPAAARAGVILALGTADQVLWVVNEAAAGNTITFAAAGTSNVADGVTTVIAGLRSACFIFDGTTNLWYRV